MSTMPCEVKAQHINHLGTSTEINKHTRCTSCKGPSKMVRVPIRKLLSDSTTVLVLDGGQGTELENRGIEVANPVWSSLPFVHESFWTDELSKERKIAEEMYSDFMTAGSNTLVTVTYQASFSAIRENTRFKTLPEYNTFLDRIVTFTRACIGKDRYLVGSVGPWGAYTCCEYTGDYGPEAGSIDYYDYFKPQLDNFNRQKEIDLIGFETVPNFEELKAILSFDEKKLAKPFYVGLSVHDNCVLRDGTSMETIAAYIKGLGDKVNPNFLLLGINCVSYNESGDILKSMHKALPNLPLLAYPNSGEVYEPNEKIWMPKADKSRNWEALVKCYIDSGARVIGGCCRTTPKDISEIAKAVDKFSRA